MAAGAAVARTPARSDSRVFVVERQDLRVGPPPQVHVRQVEANAPAQVLALLIVEALIDEHPPVDPAELARIGDGGLDRLERVGVRLHHVTDGTQRRDGVDLDREPVPEHRPDRPRSDGIARGPAERRSPVSLAGIKGSTPSGRHAS